MYECMYECMAVPHRSGRTYAQPVRQVSGVGQGGGQAHEAQGTPGLAGDEPHATHDYLTNVY